MSDAEEDTGLSVEDKALILRCARDELQIDVENDLLQEQLFKGYLVELEHGTKMKDWRANVTNDSLKATLQIAWAHILEIPDYYDWLDKMEKEAKAYWENIKNKSETDKKLELAKHVAKHQQPRRIRRNQSRFGDCL